MGPGGGRDGQRISRYREVLRRSALAPALVPPVVELSRSTEHFGSVTALDSRMVRKGGVSFLERNRVWRARPCQFPQVILRRRS